MARRAPKETERPVQPSHWGQEWDKAAAAVGIKRPPPGPIPQDDWDDQTDWVSPAPEQAPPPKTTKK